MTRTAGREVARVSLGPTSVEMSTSGARDRSFFLTVCDRPIYPRRSLRTLLIGLALRDSFGGLVLGRGG
jgi:hypothetical protein